MFDYLLSPIVEMKFIKYLLLILSVLISSCGPNHYLRKANKAWGKAIAKGAIVKSDTLWKVMEVPVPIITKDTVFKVKSFHDTITINQDNIITRFKYDTVSQIMYLESQCISDTIRIKTPVIVNKEIKTPRGFWYYFKFIAIALVVGFILGAIFWASVRLWIKSIL